MSSNKEVNNKENQNVDNTVHEKEQEDKLFKEYYGQHPKENNNQAVQENAKPLSEKEISDQIDNEMNNDLEVA